MSKQGKMFLLVNSHQADQSRRSFYLVCYKFETSLRTSDVNNMKKDKNSYWINHFWIDWWCKRYTTLQNLFVSLDEFKILYHNKKTIIASYVIYKLQVYYHSFISWYTILLQIAENPTPLPLDWTANSTI